jgi:hypothetical protein
MAKYLISSSNKAIRKGEFVTSSDGEFIIDTENLDKNIHKQNLVDVAEAHGFKINPKAKQAELLTELAEQLSTLKLPEQNEMTDTQKVEQIVKAGFEAGKTEEQMMVEIVNAGVSFKSAIKLYKAATESLGLATSAKERSEKAAAIIKEVTAGVEPKDVTAELISTLVTRIATEVKDEDEKHAMVYVRKYAKEHNIELPKAEKAAGRASGVSGLRAEAHEWMKANPTASEKELAAFITSKGKEPKKLRSYFVTFAFAKEFHAHLAK